MKDPVDAPEGMGRHCGVVGGLMIITAGLGGFLGARRREGAKGESVARRGVGSSWLGARRYFGVYRPRSSGLQ